MNAIIGTVKNGQIVLSVPADWPEGMEVRIEPIAGPSANGGQRGDEDPLSEIDQGDDPESIARWLAWYDSLEPLIMTPEERAAWQAARQEQKEFEKATFAARADRLQRMWE